MLRITEGKRNDIVHLVHALNDKSFVLKAQTEQLCMHQIIEMVPAKNRKHR